MIKKNLISLILILFFFISSCGFTPKYANYQGLNFNLIADKFSGDRELNNFMKAELKRYKKKDDVDVDTIKVDLNSKFEKNIIAKNTKGEITRYNLRALVSVTIKLNDQNKEFLFDEKFKIDKIDDSVEENNYILIVKKDFAKRIIDKLVFKIRTNNIK